MSTCRNCHKILPVNARKCPHCGVSTIVETIDCYKCGTELDMNHSYCPHCGTRLFAGQTKGPELIFDNPGLGKTENELMQRFDKSLQTRLNEEHATELHQLYRGRLEKSDFKQSIHYRIKQLAEKVGSSDKKSLRQEQNRVFEELIDYFIIHHCNDLNETTFSEKILRFQGLKVEQINLQELIRTYLDYDKTDLTFYDDFVSMPAAKLKNAADSFLFPKKGELLYLIVNLSLLGNCKEGFALTNKGIYWKMHLEKPQRVFYHKLKELQREESWIAINGIFFNANKSLNLKLLRLLKKLRELFSDSSD